MVCSTLSTRIRLANYRSTAQETILVVLDIADSCSFVRKENEENEMNREASGSYLHGSLAAERRNS